MRFVALPSHFDGDGYYRLLFPLRELARRGHQFEIGPHLIQRQGGFRRVAHYGIFGRTPDGKIHAVKAITDWLAEKPFDVLVMQQREEPFWPHEIARLQAQGKKVFVDSDDAWYNLPAWNPGSKKSPEAISAMAAQVKSADGLSVATPALADMYWHLNKNVRVIRNRLDWGMWADTVPSYQTHTSRIRVGWMGDTRWRKGDLAVLREFIGPWLEQHPEVEFVAAGDPKAHDLLGIPEAQRVSVASVAFSNMDLADITAPIDIGLVPLDLRDPKARSLNECKSHLKGMEYNAAGAPFIASPSESYRWYAENGGVGLLPKTPANWRDCLDVMLRELKYPGIGETARKAARAHAIDLHAEEWEGWYGGDSRADRDTAVALAAAQ